MPKWDLNQLRAAVESRHGRSQRKAISPSVDSIEQRRNFASYHYHESLRVMKEATSAHDGDLAIMLLIMGADEDASSEFRWASFQAAAHVTACVQSMHSVADILAHTLYYAYGMNLDQGKTLDAHRIGIRTVSQRLPEGTVKEQLKKLVEHESFVYLSALTNHSKHRSIVTTPYSLDLTGEAASSHGLKFSAFEYDGENFTERWVRPTLEAEYTRQARLIISLGQALNASLIADT